MHPTMHLQRRDDECDGSPAETSNMGLRIGSVFILLAASLLGALFPILVHRSSHIKAPPVLFFVLKFIGTGVIIATAWMHLLAPAAEQLGDPCLVDRLGEYDWAFFIGLMTVLTMFLAELLATHFGKCYVTEAEGAMLDSAAVASSSSDGSPKKAEAPYSDDGNASDPAAPRGSLALHGDREADTHLANHDRAHPVLAGQLTAILILEFGVIFHSVFIGLVLATTDNLVILLVVLVFHQFMEGLGLGSRLAIASWPGGRWWLPYFLAGCYGLATPVGIAAGLGAKPTSAADQTLTNGVFDAISAGILMYTGLVELLAHEFMLNPQMRKSGLAKQLGAFVCIIFGAAIMALLAKWA
ncbi:hypothetical protein ACHAQH_000535 [Verticillium albo-atrum]